MNQKTTLSVILLAGGLGTRMQAAIPKQFLLLQNKPIALYSFDLFLTLPEVDEIVVVCDPAYRHLFSSNNLKISFADPGERRQDSVWNGFNKSNADFDWICIHDSARPFITSSLVLSAIEAAKEQGAAALGMPLKFTVKECNEQGWVKNTPSRDRLWEIQTPQVIRRDLLQKGFQLAQELNATVTDDLSLVELFSNPVRIVKGSYENIKITTPEDLIIAESILRNRNGKRSV